MQIGNIVLIFQHPVELVPIYLSGIWKHRILIFQHPVELVPIYLSGIWKHRILIFQHPVELVPIYLSGIWKHQDFDFPTSGRACPDLFIGNLETSRSNMLMKEVLNI